MKALFTTLAILVLTSFAIAQPGTFTTYGSACGSSQPLAVTGVPKIGTTITVSGISFPSFCTRKFCGCNVGKCNDCQGAVLFIGVNRVNAPLPGGCPLLNSADIILAAAFPGTIALPIPNDPSLFNLQFHMQRADLALAEMITASCSTRYDPVAFNGTSNGVTGTIGL